MRTFIVKINHPFTDVQLNNLTEGRIDLVARCVTSALWLDHGIRRDVRITFCFENGVAITVDGHVRQMRPDERNIAGFLRGLLNGSTYPGITREEKSLDAVLKGYPERYILEREGKTIEGLAFGGDATFVLGDDEGLGGVEGEKISVGPLSYLTSHCIAVINNRMDVKT